MNIEARDTNITRTVNAWKGMGIDVAIIWKKFPVRKSVFTDMYRQQIFVALKGERMTFDEFAAQYPYAANPSE